MKTKSSNYVYKKCNICMDDVSINNFKNYNCRHNWCNICDKKLDKFNIETCPFCRKEINKKGKWELKKYSKVVIWKWRNGKNETLKTKIIKKIQENLLNLGTSYALITGRAI
jgi:hypothetical protein